MLPGGCAERCRDTAGTPDPDPDLDTGVPVLPSPLVTSPVWPAASPRAGVTRARCGVESVQCVQCTVQCCVQCTVYSTAGFRQRVQSKADQQRVTGDLIHGQTMQPGHHLPSHDLTAVVVITPSPCCVFRPLPLTTLQTGGGAEAGEHCGGSRGRVGGCVMLGGAAL